MMSRVHTMTTGRQITKFVSQIYEQLRKEGETN